MEALETLSWILCLVSAGIFYFLSSLLHYSAFPIKSTSESKPSVLHPAILVKIGQHLDQKCWFDFHQEETHLQWLPGTRIIHLHCPYKYYNALSHTQHGMDSQHSVSVSRVCHHVGWWGYPRLSLPGAISLGIEVSYWLIFDFYILYFINKAWSLPNDFLCTIFS